ncbi:hypothetical protein DMC63_38125 [Streptomyces sp. WAC 05977]|nr:hypothetical protein DMC63_38125 [Streptomyces sp. WAC 05977]
MTTRICETHRRSGTHAARRLARVAAEPGRPRRVVAEPETHASLLDDVLTAIRHFDGAALAPRSRRRLPGWSPRDRRVQRLRGWLSGAPG